MLMYKVLQKLSKIIGCEVYDGSMPDVFLDRSLTNREKMDKS